MRRLLVCLSAAALLAGGGTAVAGTDGGAVARTCYAGVPGAATLNTPQRLGCRMVDQADRQAGATCRIAVTDGSCTVVDGRDISAAAVVAYQRSWVHRALSLQRQLDASVPLLDSQLVHTHNSFNASAYALDGPQRPSYYPTLTNQDANQAYSLTDQLDLDVRFVELDLHWVPSPYGTVATHGYWVTLCHGDGQQAPVTGTWVHVGCTADRPAEDGFAELRRWLDAHPREFVFVYLENQLYDGSPLASQLQAHDTAASLIAATLGPLVYRPSGAGPGRCADVPYTASVDDLRRAGARVLLLGNCGPGSSWSSWVFQRGPLWNESGNPTTYSAADCAKDMAARRSGSDFRRFFEDSTVVAAAEQSTTQITAVATAQMVRCGVNIIGMDEIGPTDPRLAALVWSWAPGQPAAGSCARVDTDGRFFSTRCGEQHPYACRTGGIGDWRVTDASGPWRDGPVACAAEFPGSTFAVPVDGYDDGQLRAAHGAWVAYAEVHGTWRNLTGADTSGADAGGPDGHGHGHGGGHSHGDGHGRTGHGRSIAR